MTWNLGGLNKERYDTAGFPLVEYIASVMQEGHISLIGFTGVLADLGDELGRLLCNELNNRVKSMYWTYVVCPPLGAGRGEKYLLLWDRSAFNVYAPDGSTYSLLDYPLPSGQTGFYGFPRPRTASPDMPPWTMFFKLGASTSFITVSLFHAPDWSLGLSPGQGVLAACTNISQIATVALAQGQGGLLMGTFNVPVNDDVNATGSNGAAALAPLAGPEGKYTQAFNNQQNLLSNVASVAMTMEDALAQTADNIFFRRDGIANGITLTNAGVANVLLSALGSLDASGNWVTAPLGPSLAKIEFRPVAEEYITAEPDGSYVKLEDAFAVYRTYVSAYLPVMCTLNY
ncbi:hypothetical protein [Sorangium sp. So ce1000]|uniref:hypothetical protein n=1 Tax=Sorangium sp. So ce1000 TaxID=3133325 RepID=UPI003F6190E2